MKHLHERRMSGLGEAVDRGIHQPGAVPAMRGQMAPGYRGLSNQESIARKFKTENDAQQGPLLRQRQVNEATNYVGQSHPIQDAQFNSEGIHFYSGLTNIGAGATLNFPIVTTRLHFVGFIRQLVANLVTANATEELRITALVNGSPFPGLRRVPLTCFQDITSQHNIYIKLMPQKQLVLSVDNDGAGIHTFGFCLMGWQYPVPNAVETSRGVMQNKGAL